MTLHKWFEDQLTANNHATLTYFMHSCPYSIFFKTYFPTDGHITHIELDSVDRWLTEHSISHIWLSGDSMGRVRSTTELFDPEAAIVGLILEEGDDVLFFKLTFGDYFRQKTI